ncbi:hypothetical protein PsorP6_011180 [Peronosclerospora sorghi]|uniref:Uncharacterized protein n=1 Tax=Peronosclerospora sorghi TaxID=230839 RepID=A0ACC0VVK2_9STRA|nr:hypothetical protein PsorP6_011180 [Peronosclerospora sorghi]
MHFHACPRLPCHQDTLLCDAHKLHIASQGAPSSVPIFPYIFETGQIPLCELHRTGGLFRRFAEASNGRRAEGAMTYSEKSLDRTHWGRPDRADPRRRTFLKFIKASSIYVIRCQERSAISRSFPSLCLQSCELIETIPVVQNIDDVNRMLTPCRKRTIFGR